VVQIKQTAVVKKSLESDFADNVIRMVFLARYRKKIGLKLEP
jgi:hypothetical protein